MNGFELRMRKADLHEKRQIVGRVQERFEIAQRDWNSIGWRRHEHGSRKRGAARADPIRTSPEFARSEVRTPDPLQELGVDFSNQTDRNRQLLQTRQACIHGAHIVDDFFDIAWRIRGEHLRLCRQQILQRALRALVVSVP